MIKYNGFIIQLYMLIILLLINFNSEIFLNLVIIIPLSDNENEGSFYKVSDGTNIFYSIYIPSTEPKKTIYIISGYTGINHITDKDIPKIL